MNMTHWSTLVLLQIMVHISISFKFMTHPEADLTMEEKITRRGYPFEVHEVVTEDNYILTTHRVPHGRKSQRNGTNGSPVLLIHGMGGQAEYFLVLGRHSIVYYLADRGFDVWMLNARGSLISQKHKYYDSQKDHKYWKFSYHEIGVYDIPANIDYIKNKTNQKAFLIGHSQGNTCCFVMLTERPEYNDKIKMNAVYAPSLFLKYMDYPFASVFSHLVDFFQMIYDFLGMGALFPNSDTAAFLIKILCSETTFFLPICSNILAVIGSHKSQLTTNDIVTLVCSIPPTQIAARQLFHYMQGLNTGIFRQYDYGEAGNLKKYNSRTPPEYNLTKAVAPVALFYAEKDDITSIEGVFAAMKALPNVILSYKVPYKYFNHIDFIFATNASNMVYKRNVKLFRDFDKGKLGRKIWR